jgi:geranylgeranyl pyrophosphate synthase
MDWEKTLDRYGFMVEERVKRYFTEVNKEARAYHPFIAKVYSGLEEFLLRRGKRLASCSTLLAYEGYSGRVDDGILDVCVGIEIYRHSILIHDDLVDMDTFRRGGTTLHKAFMGKRDNRFGEGTAIFVGNIACALAFNALTSSGFAEEKVVRSLRLLSKGYQEVNESQILDLLFEYKAVGVNEWRIMASKRAASLFKATMLIGAVLGGAPESDIRLLEDAAKNMGYSFDIQDDIIDAFVNEEQYGRPPCRDIIRGKKPLHMVYALNSEKQKKTGKLRGRLGKKSLNNQDVDFIRMAIKENGGLEEAKKESRAHAEKAKALISQTSLNSKVKEFFNSFIAYIEESLDWYK